MSLRSLLEQDALENSYTLFDSVSAIESMIQQAMNLVNEGVVTTEFINLLVTLDCTEDNGDYPDKLENLLIKAAEVNALEIVRYMMQAEHTGSVQVTNAVMKKFFSIGLSTTLPTDILNQLLLERSETTSLFFENYLIYILKTLNTDEQVRCIHGLLNRIPNYLPLHSIPFHKMLENCKTMIFYHGTGDLVNRLDSIFQYSTDIAFLENANKILSNAKNNQSTTFDNRLVNILDPVKRDFLFERLATEEVAIACKVQLQAIIDTLFSKVKQLYMQKVKQSKSIFFNKKQLVEIGMLIDTLRAINHDDFLNLPEKIEKIEYALINHRDHIDARMKKKHQKKSATRDFLNEFINEIKLHELSMRIVDRFDLKKISRQCN